MLTLSHANHLPITIQYPYEKLITSVRSCEVCVLVCPIDLPTVDWKLEADIRKKRLFSYSIDFEICIFCGNGVHICPINLPAID